MRFKHSLILMLGVLALLLILGGFKYIFAFIETSPPSSLEQVSDSPWPVEIPLPTEHLKMNSASFEETGCYGECPIYKFIITADNRYVIIPKMFTRVERETRGRLPDGTFYELAKFVEQSKFGNKNTHYSEYRTSKEKPCPGYGTDNVTSILAIKTLEKTTNFNMYWGCWGATDLDDIKLFFQSIETILDLENLVYIDAKNQEELFK